MMKRILVLAVIALALLTVSCGSKPEYNPMQYVTLDVKYFNGEGVAEPVVTPPATTDEQSSKVIELLKVTKFNYSPDNKLSNGDVVTVVPVYDEEKAKKQGFTPVVEATKFTVEGLPEGIEVDLWEWQGKAKYKGYNGSATLSVGLMPMPDDAKLLEFLADWVSYGADKTDKLSNGDSITFTATHNVEAARKAGYKIISEPTKTFTVEGLE